MLDRRALTWAPTIDREGRSSALETQTPLYAM